MESKDAVVTKFLEGFLKKPNETKEAIPHEGSKKEETPVFGKVENFSKLSHVVPEAKPKQQTHAAPSATIPTAGKSASPADYSCRAKTRIILNPKDPHYNDELALKRARGYLRNMCPLNTYLVINHLENIRINKNILSNYYGDKSIADRISYALKLEDLSKKIDTLEQIVEVKKRIDSRYSTKEKDKVIEKYLRRKDVDFCYLMIIKKCLPISKIAKIH